MLKAHLDAIEDQLLATSQIPANAGHTLHRGTPRESFIKKFLEGHISTRVDAASPPRQQRNQFDIVVYRNDYPRLDLGGGINAFLAESVISTIEVKSLLTEKEMEKAILSAQNVKRLQRNVTWAMSSGYNAPGILSYVVAYDGPAKILTVHQWIKNIKAKHGLNITNLPPTRQQRNQILSETVEGVFLLGRGSIIFDNAPLSLITDAERQQTPSGKYQLFAEPHGNIMLLFLLITQAVSGVSLQTPNIFPYLSSVGLQVQFLP
jgi:Domain of unknown function (DUF6602)